MLTLHRALRGLNWRQAAKTDGGRNTAGETELRRVIVIEIYIVIVIDRVTARNWFPFLCYLRWLHAHTHSSTPRRN